jgi:molybdenum cofactor cytidylyltransferase
MIVAIVPAAGRSQRMGQPKLLLPLGGRRVLEHVLAALARSAVDAIVVGVAPGAGELRAVAHSFGVEVAELVEPTADMRETVARAMDHAEARWGRSQLDAMLLALADQPTIVPAVIDDLIARFRGSRMSICIPTYNGRRGHPVLFDWRIARGIHNLAAGVGLNTLVARHAGEVEECPQRDASVLDDMDTPSDYDRLRRRSSAQETTE